MNIRPHFSRVVIKNSENQILLIHMPKYEEWTFPGGKIEPGETPEQCAVREVKEELNLDIINLKPLFDIYQVWHNKDGAIPRYGFFYSADATNFIGLRNMDGPSKCADIRFFKESYLLKTSLPLSKAVKHYITRFIQH